MDANSKKILFRFFSDVLEEWTIETLWSEVVDAEKGLYKLANIPFYASVSCEDIVYAEFDENEHMLTYRKTVEHSGNSTIQVLIVDKRFVSNELRDLFVSFGCESEKFSDEFLFLKSPKI
jgi:hypothetical protein